MRRLKKLSKRPWTSGLLAGCLAAVALLATASAASAVTYRPTRTDDPAPNGCKKKNCSLREAVIASNASGTPATILLRPGKRYVLTRKGAGENAALTGDLDITSGPLVVKTEGGGKTDPATIDANGIDRIFDGSLTLNGVTLRDGHARVVAGDTGVGGAIRGGILDIRNSRLVNNTADFHPSNLSPTATAAPSSSRAAARSTSTGRGSRATRPPRRGGAIFVSKSGSASLFKSTLARNESGGSGGRARHRRGCARRNQPLDHLRQQSGSLFRFRWRHRPQRPAGGTDGDTRDPELNGRRQQRRQGRWRDRLGGHHRLREPRDRGARLRHDRSQPGEHRAR